MLQSKATPFKLGLFLLALLAANAIGFALLIQSPVAAAGEQAARAYLPVVAGGHAEASATPVSYVAMTRPPIEAICQYNVVFFNRDMLLDGNGQFDANGLEVAHLCGTQVVLRLHSLSGDITADGGGLDLARFADQIDDFAGVLDPYVANGTVIAHLTIDEPHDCQDWAGVCPQPAEVDQAAAISRQHWPELATAVNTIPSYGAAYTWQHTDELIFTYAFHKGDLDSYVANGASVLANGRARRIGWAMQAAYGGCPQFGQCSMTPEQVRAVGEAMCAATPNVIVGFVRYRPDLMTPEMLQSIADVKVACGEPARSLATVFGVTGLAYADYDNNQAFSAESDQPLAAITVTLTSSAGHQWVTTTDSSGIYQFENVAAGRYSLGLGGLPAGHAPLAPQEIVVGQQPAAVADLPVRVNELAGVVYRDYDANLVFGPPEDIPYSGAIIRLRRPDGSIMTTTSGGDGRFAFRALADGSYTLSVDPASIDAGWRALPGNRVRNVIVTTTANTLDFAVQPPGASPPRPIRADGSRPSAQRLP